MIVFVEDSAQFEKLKSNYVDDTKSLLIIYKGRRIQKVEIFENGLLHNINIFKVYEVILLIIFSKYLVVEYANFLPRTAAFLLRKPIVSVLFGTLTKNNFKKYKFIPAKLQPLRADTYIIVGEYNQTKKIAIFLKSFSNVIFKKRADIPDFQGIPIKDYILFIGQSFDKEGMPFYQGWEHKIMLLLISSGNTVIYCRHPRSNKSENYEKEIDGYIECIEFIKENGRPDLAVSLTSSMINELRESGVNSQNLIVGEYLSEEIQPNLNVLKKYVN